MVASFDSECATEYWQHLRPATILVEPCLTWTRADIDHFMTSPPNEPSPEPSASSGNSRVLSTIAAIAAIAPDAATIFKLPQSQLTRLCFVAICAVPLFALLPRIRRWPHWGFVGPIAISLLTTSVVYSFASHSNHQSTNNPATSQAGVTISEYFVPRCTLFKGATPGWNGALWLLERNTADGARWRARKAERLGGDQWQLEWPLGDATPGPREYAVRLILADPKIDGQLENMKQPIRESDLPHIPASAFKEITVKRDPYSTKDCQPGAG